MMAEKYVLGYDSGTVSEPILWKLIKDFNIQVNILKASISPGLEGSLLVELHADQHDDVTKALAWLESVGVSCVSVAKRLSWDEDRCVDCGACTGVCFSQALSMDRVSWKLKVDKDKCVACGNCVKACPLSCYTLNFGD
jgi:ferredoxin